MSVPTAATRKVTIIPADLQYTQKDIRKQHLRVAPYCRVSTDSDEQKTSYEAQIAYYTEKIAENPDWTMVRLYADATCIIGTNQSPSEWAAICPYFSYFQHIWRRHTR